jgi:hypothetical protein
MIQDFSLILDDFDLKLIKYRNLFIYICRYPGLTVENYKFIMKEK